MLGPLPFLLYINDITGNIQSNIHLFADDCIVYRTIRSQDDSCKLQYDISSLLRARCRLNQTVNRLVNRLVKCERVARSPDRRLKLT